MEQESTRIRCQTWIEKQGLNHIDGLCGSTAAVPQIFLTLLIKKYSKYRNFIFVQMQCPEKWLIQKIVLYYIKRKIRTKIKQNIFE